MERFLDSLSRIPYGNPTTNESNKEREKTYKKDLISPKQQDTLFWSLYIIKYGYDEYLMIQDNYGSNVMNAKQQIMEDIQKNPNKYRHTNYKMTKSGLKELMSELITNYSKTSYNVLIALCCYYGVNIYLVNKERKTFLEFISNNTAPSYFLYKSFGLSRFK